jgi:membrane protease YdiL (CAAX protease family)
MIGFIAVAMPVIRELGESGTFVGDSARIVGALAYVAVVILLYRELVRRIEDRPATELGRDPGIGLACQGLAIGLLIWLAVIGIMWLAGGVRPVGPGDASRVASALAAAMIAAVGEEILFRGVLFRIVEQATGTLAALLVSALLFGLAHLASANATLISCLGIAIEAGILLGLAFALTRNLWFPIGIHFAWNFTQAGIFGIAGSEATSRGLVTLEFSGPDWLTGDAFGPETSIIAVGLCLALAIGFAHLTRKRGQWKKAELRFQLD